jgi:hypothetical protein
MSSTSRKAQSSAIPALLSSLFGFSRDEATNNLNPADKQPGMLDTGLMQRPLLGLDC